MNPYSIKSWFENDVLTIAGNIHSESKIVSLYNIITNNYVYVDHNKCKRDLYVFNGLICPHCLCYIDFEKLSLNCPYCGELHTHNFNGWYRKFDANKINVKVSDLQMLIFKNCIKCNGELEFIACPECKKPINLTTKKYFKESLEGERRQKAREESIK